MILWGRKDAANGELPGFRARFALGSPAMPATGEGLGVNERGERPGRHADTVTVPIGDPSAGRESAGTRASPCSYPER